MLKIKIFGVLAAVALLFTGIENPQRYVASAINSVQEQAYLAMNPEIVDALEESTFMIMRGEGHGTGFAITDRLIVTNFHVIEKVDAFGRRAPGVIDEVIALDIDNRSFLCLVVAYDPYNDLALLMVADENIKLKGLPVLPTSQLPLGDIVYTMGNSRNERWDADVGRVYYNKYLGVRNWNLMSQTVLYLNARSGSSGSPFLNANGQVVGVLFAGNGVTVNMSPAIHIINMLKEVVDARTNGHDFSAPLNTNPNGHKRGLSRDSDS